MDDEIKRLDVASRNVIAQRIWELRRTRKIWAPLAPMAHHRCRRSMGDVEFATQHVACVSDLVHLCEAYKKNPDEVRVSAREESVPYEDYSVEVVTLTTVEKFTDREYAAQIQRIWDEYQEAKQAARGQQARYAEFLALKAEFEPG